MSQNVPVRPSETGNEFALVWFDTGGRIVRQGAGAKRMFGDADSMALARELLGRTESGAHSWFDEVLGGEVIVGRDVTRTLSDGRTTRLVVSSAPTFDREENVTGASAIFVDVGAIRRVEESQRLLIEAGRVLASSLDYDETMRDAVGLFIPRLADWCLIFVREADETIRLASVAHSDPMLAVTARKLLEHFHPNINESGGIGEIIRTGQAIIAPEGNAAFIDAMRAIAPEQTEQLLQGGALGWMIVPLRSRDRTLGVICFASSHQMRHYDSADLALAEELARRVATAVDNARLYAAARAAIAARDGVLGIVAHDLRNPVGTIQMTADLLLDDVVDAAAQKKYFGIIRRATERMKHLIQDLLDVTSMEAGQLTVDKQPVEVPALLNEVREMFSAQTSGKLQRLEFDVPADLPPIQADRDRLLQVFSNLVGNAVKFTPEGGRITVSVQRDGRATTFIVSDTGPGIPAHELPRVFDRFWQSRRARRGGAGLGLAITKGIMEAHGGTVRASSVPGEGTVFTFTLPDE